MSNSVFGSMDSNSCSETPPLTSQKQSDSESKSCELEQNSLIKASFNFPTLDNITTQSPDRTMLESFLNDPHFNSEFMIWSPTIDSTSTYNNYTQIEKGMSPLHKLFINESLPDSAIDELFENYQEDGFEEPYDPKAMNNLSVRSPLHCNNDIFNSIDHPVVPFAEDLTELDKSSSFCGLSGETLEPGGFDHLSQERNNFHAMGSNIIEAPLVSLEFQQEKEQECLMLQTLREPHEYISRSLMLPAFPIGSRQEQDGGLQMVHLLLSCAEAVSKKDYMSARRYTYHLNQVASPLGNSMQRVVCCFTDALSTRLTSTLTITTKPSTSNSKPNTIYPPNTLKISSLFQIISQTCPYTKLIHFTANQSILEAFESEQRVHIIDLDIYCGYQWPDLMHALASRPTGAPFLRITGIGPVKEVLEGTGRCLAQLARSLNIPFKFHAVGEKLEDIKPHMLNRHVGEALAVNSICVLHKARENYRYSLIKMIHDQAPNIVTLVEQEASLNGSYFLGRFLEALHYFSAIFDSMDALFPLDSPKRVEVEQGLFAAAVRNIVACEGSERIVRLERFEKWRKVMEGKGFKNIALSEDCITQGKTLMGLYNCNGYRLTKDQGCLLLGWEDKPIISVST